MIFGLLNKNGYATCGQKTDGESAVKHSSKNFCSQEHADEYSKKQEAEQPKNDGGSCCG